MARLAVNGLGQIDKLVLRRLIRTSGCHEIALLNAPAGNPAQHTTLIEFDSAHGRWLEAFGFDHGSLSVDVTLSPFVQVRRIEDLPLATHGIDIVVDCTGVFTSTEEVELSFRAGVQKAVISAPIKNGALYLVIGVSQHLDKVGKRRNITAAICTKSCGASVVRVLHEAIGIKCDSITTIHDFRNTQTIVDHPARNNDWEVSPCRNGVSIL
ncbi:MAG: glyceraldehyde 3-phosphate dehydrogenase NAD-binding domain-containing protein [Devosia sp.]